MQMERLMVGVGLRIAASLYRSRPRPGTALIRASATNHITRALCQRQNSLPAVTSSLPSRRSKYDICMRPVSHGTVRFSTWWWRCVGGWQRRRRREGAGGCFTEALSSAFNMSSRGNHSQPLTTVSPKVSYKSCRIGVQWAEGPNTCEDQITSNH